MMRRNRHRKFQVTLLLLSIIGLLIIFFMPDLNDSGALPAEQIPAGTAATSPLPPKEQVQATPTATPEPTALPPTEEPEPVYADAVWMAVGDVMMHKPQLPGAYDKKTKRFDFNPFFAHVKPILAQGDFVIANLETPMAGADLGYSGYPLFNAPEELGEALKAAGFNLITNANNHSLDQGEVGILRTLDSLKTVGLPSTGTAASQDEADNLLLTEKNGIVMGLLAYTYGTNGIKIPEGKPYLVSLIDEEKIKADMHRLREAGADFITVSLHFGTEYQITPNDEQKRLARSLVAAGADIIAGSHPHVIQPYEVIETTDENGHAKKGLIIYSMGNFISNQRGDSKDYGVIFKVNIRKNMTDGSVDIIDVESIPTWVHRYKPDQSYRYRVLPVEETIAAANDPLLTEADYEVLQKNILMLRNRLDSMK
ncbi:CapA family protein [Paenibacillus sinopodophylli]|uniref:CapA family protein n=1 Tax=Paenibacillus sinopodophylli TaxID=1837342 RepID=UPI001FE8846B|nr:CapA family protein [Paenibacillus sinopodophylli]